MQTTATSVLRSAQLLVAASTLALAGPTRAAPVVPAADHSVERAISKVFPALVQIRVLSVDHSTGRERKFEASGSGVIISGDGYVVTNHHVAGKAASIRVTLSSKEELEAELVGTDALADIAVLKLDLSSRGKGAQPIPTAQFGAAAKLRIGDTVLAMGCPLALSHSVTQGIVANKDMMLPRPMNGRFTIDGEDVGALVKWIGHDAAIQPGNSGGPLVNLDGEVVGINEIGLGSMSGAIPSELARLVAQELIANGKVKRAWIGADFQPLLKRRGQDPEARGVLVAGVLSGSPAEAAGLRAGDVVTALDGTPVNARFREELPAFNLLLLGKPVGPKLHFELLRGQKPLTLNVTTDLREDAQGKESEAKEWGLAIEPITTPIEKEMQLPDLRGVLVGSVRSGGPSDQAVPPLAARDVIVEVNGKPVADVEGFSKITKAILEGKTAPVPTLITFERQTERLITLVEVGLRIPQEPPSEVRKPWLPVATQVLTKKLAAVLGLKGKTGVRLTQVFPNGSAEAAGLKVGDIVTQIDGNPIEASEPHDADVFDGMIRSYKLGAKPELTVYRDGKPSMISVVLDEGPKPEREMKIYEDTALEFRARDISTFDRVRRRWSVDEAGAIVSQVESGGWAAVGGLHEGDLIQAVDGQKIAAVPELETQMKAVRERKNKQIALLVRRGVHTLFVELEPKWK